MKYSIPFFGEQHNEIVEQIIASKPIDDILTYNTMYKMITTESFKRCVVIIDNAWFAWLRDVQFNYRDGKVLLPYFTYDLYDVKLTSHSTDNRGHLIFDKKTKLAKLRYNFELQYYELNINTPILLYDLDAERKYYVQASNWYDDIFSIDALYKKYLNSCYYVFDELLEKHEGGYHYIVRQYKGFVNREYQLRKQLNLPHFKTYVDIKDFRDVREYKFEELFKNTLRDDILPYKIRRLLFDCMLYCIIQHGSTSDDEAFNKRYSKLKEGKCILVYKPINDIPALIFKSYWFGQGSYADKRKILKKV